MWSRPPNVQNEPYGIVAGSGCTVGECITVARPVCEIVDRPFRTRAAPACSVAYDMERIKLAFGFTELADKILGEEFREIQSAFSEINRIAFEAINDDTAFEVVHVLISLLPLSFCRAVLPSVVVVGGLAGASNIQIAHFFLKHMRKARFFSKWGCAHRLFNAYDLNLVGLIAWPTLQLPY